MPGEPYREPQRPPESESESDNPLDDAEPIPSRELEARYKALVGENPDPTSELLSATAKRVLLRVLVAIAIATLVAMCWRR